jgi:hypothetical protein
MVILEKSVAFVVKIAKSSSIYIIPEFINGIGRKYLNSQYWQNS